MAKENCTFRDCGRTTKAHGLCSTHYEQERRGAALSPILSTRPIAVRFAERHSKGPGCWVWEAFIADNGYGLMPRNTGTPYAHRISYEIHIGPIPEGMSIDHACFNKACVNPAHLAAVSTKQNMENRAGPQRNSKTGIRGVFLTPKGRYRVQITHNRRSISGGSYDSMAEAESAAIALRNKSFTNNLLDRKAS